jgi:PBP1b-binding outer membrane lipoprotein LpoB
MKIRGLLAALLVAVSLGGCTGTATAPEATRTPAATAPSFDETPPPPADTVQTAPTRTGGAMGSGN